MGDLRLEIAKAASALRARHPADGVFAAEQLPAQPWTRLARSTSGFAFVLPKVVGPLEPDLDLEHLSVRFNVHCEIEAGGRTRREELTIVECRSPDERLQNTFLEVAALVLPSREDDIAQDLKAAVASLSELFRAMLAPGPKSVLGLWGELFTMARANDGQLAAAAWHSTPQDRYDFAAGRLRIEVKTTTGVRAHHFSLEQLQPPPGVRVLVASIVTTVSPAGPSIQELLEQVVSRADPENRSHVILMAMRSLGAAWSQGAAARFDADLAGATFRWVDCRNVPRVADPPLEVREVRFLSDLQTCEGLSDTDVVASGDLGAAMVHP